MNSINSEGEERKRDIYYKFLLIKRKIRVRNELTYENDMETSCSSLYAKLAPRFSSPSSS